MRFVGRFLSSLGGAATLLVASNLRAEEPKWTLVAAGTPLVKLDFRHDGLYVEPSFLPGPGFGYIWGKGYFGVVAFPGIFLRRTTDVVLAPHLTAHAYFVSVGFGYELQFGTTNSSESKFREGFPFFSFGLTLPVQAWVQK